MKKILLISLFVLTGWGCNAQIYTSVKYFDKFDDVLKQEQRKTLVQKNDTTFVIEEKGKAPAVYYILNKVEADSQGSKDNVVNLVNDVYGYEETWCVIREDMYKAYLEAYSEYYETIDERIKAIQPYWLFIIHRTITTQYTGSYLTEYLWIQDEFSDGKLGKDINRIIYSMR